MAALTAETPPTDHDQLLLLYRSICMRSGSDDDDSRNQQRNIPETPKGGTHDTNSTRFLDAFVGCVQAKLEEPLIVRPTSETIIWTMFRKWIDSYRYVRVFVSYFFVLFLTLNLRSRASWALSTPQNERSCVLELGRCSLSARVVYTEQQVVLDARRINESCVLQLARSRATCVCAEAAASMYCFKAVQVLVSRRG